MKKRNEVLRERVAHGTALFPLMVHEVQTDERFLERVSCHWHEEMELLVVIKGEAEVHIDNRSYAVKNGSVVFIPSNCLHSMTGKDGIPFSFFAIVFDAAFLDSFVTDTVQKRYIDTVKQGEILFTEAFFPVQGWEKKVSELLFEIRGLFEVKSEAYELLIKARLYEIWYLFYLHADHKKEKTEKREDCRVVMTKSVIRYLEEHYAEHITLTELAETYHLSAGHLCRMFRAVTKMSVVEYLNRYRISRSTELLESTDSDIGRIAGMVGFNNISYYNKIFMRYMHMTPGNFRKML